MKIERIQHDYSVYSRTSHERVNANIKKTETSDAVSLDGEKSGQRERQEHPDRSHDQKPASDSALGEVPVPPQNAEIVRAGIDIRV